MLLRLSFGRMCPKGESGSSAFCWERVPAGRNGRGVCLLLGEGACKAEEEGSLPSPGRRCPQGGRGGSPAFSWEKVPAGRKRVFIFPHQSHCARQLPQREAYNTIPAWRIRIFCLLLGEGARRAEEGIYLPSSVSLRSPASPKGNSRITSALASVSGGTQATPDGCSTKNRGASSAASLKSNQLLHALSSRQRPQQGILVSILNIPANRQPARQAADLDPHR